MKLTSRDIFSEPTTGNTEDEYIHEEVDEGRNFEVLMYNRIVSTEDWNEGKKEAFTHFTKTWELTNKALILGVMFCWAGAVVSSIV